MSPHFDGTITLGNIVTLSAGLLVAILAWRDLNWRTKNLEEWKLTQDASNLTVINNVGLLKEAVAKLTAMVEGQDRRIIMLEDRDRRA